MKKNDEIATIMSAIGGFIFSIPWIIFNVNEIITINFLTILIPFGIVIFFRLFKGKIFESFYSIIFFVSVTIATLINTIVIPFILMIINNVALRFDNFIFFYKIPSFRSSILINIFINIIFILLGTIIIRILFNNRLKKEVK